MSAHAAPRARHARFGPPIPRTFYDRDTEEVARALLGAVLVHDSAAGTAAGRIVETEAYLGEHDPACHAAAGRTRRTAPLYGPPGHAYVYFIYGVHWCANAVTRADGLPSAVLVRALQPVAGLPLMWARRPAARRATDLTNGPGKLCAALAITGALDGAPLDSGPLRIHAGTPVASSDVDVTPRIGIRHAAHWPLRWLVRDNPYVSRTPSHFPRTPDRP